MLERTFSDLGRPVGYIAGEEVSGAAGVGLRYGEGYLTLKGSPDQQKVYWQGPTVGFDAGGNASRVFTLVYRLNDTDRLYQRFPGVEGSAYLVAGMGVNYQRATASPSPRSARASACARAPMWAISPIRGSATGSRSKGEFALTLTRLARELRLDSF